MADLSSLIRAEQSGTGPRSSSVGERLWDLRRVVGATALASAVLVAVAALPFLHRPLSPDESGFVLVARHWHPGSSLDGPYWVDRPPLPLELFSLGGRFEPVDHSPAGLIAPSVRLLGAAASGLAVASTTVLGYVIAPRRSWTRQVTVLVAVALLTGPLIGMPEANGELLAVPFVLAGVACRLAGVRRGGGRHALLLTATAGAAATSAALVEQNSLHVFVFAVGLFVASGARLLRRGRHVVAFVGASGGVLAAALAAAAVQGTTPVAFWDAVLVFRLQASAVSSGSAAAATAERMGHRALASVGSGALVLLVVGAAAVLRRLVARQSAARRDPTGDGGLPAAFGWGALAMGVGELCGVALGGSYRLHHFTGAVAGILLLLAVARPTRGRRRAVELAGSYAASVSAAAVGLPLAAVPPASQDAPVIAHLQAHPRPTDGVVVAFGHPDMVAASGLSSPYEQLWSLPVRDPGPREPSGVLSAPAAPRWIVVEGDSHGSWGLDAGAADAGLRQRHVERSSYGVWHVWQSERQGAGR